MHFTFQVLFSVVSVLVLTIESSHGCSTWRVRKEFRDMSSQDWKTYKAAVDSLYNSRLPSASAINEWTRLHFRNARFAHNTPHFLAWHRYYIFLFENHLRTISSNITLPYWDWSFDYQKPGSSPLLGRKYLDTRPGRRDCRYLVNTTTTHCLLRNYNRRSLGPFHAPSIITNLISSTNRNFDSFRRLLEFGPHATVHAQIGGEGGDLASMISPNDPIFFLHHAMIDKIWHDWQMQPGNNQLNYGGRLASGRTATIADHLMPWNIPVREAMELEANCIRYQPFSRRSNINLLMPLQLPKPLPQFWIKMHGLDPETIKEIEREIENLLF